MSLGSFPSTRQLALLKSLHQLKLKFPEDAEPPSQWIEAKKQYGELDTLEQQVDWIKQYRNRESALGERLRNFHFTWEEYCKEMAFFSQYLIEYILDIVPKIDVTQRLPKWHRRRNTFVHLTDQRMPQSHTDPENQKKQMVLNFEEEIEVYDLHFSNIVEELLETFHKFEHSGVDPRLLERNKLMDYADEAYQTNKVLLADLDDCLQNIKDMGKHRYVEATLYGSEVVAYDRLQEVLHPTTGSNCVEIIGEGGLGKTALMYYFVHQNISGATKKRGVPQYEKYLILSAKSKEQGEHRHKIGRRGVEILAPERTASTNYLPELDFDEFISLILALRKVDTTDMSGDEKEDRAKREIAANRFLIVLDNFEDVPEEGVIRYHKFIDTIAKDSQSNFIITGREDYQESPFVKLKLDQLSPEAAQELMLLTYREYARHDDFHQIPAYIADLQRRADDRDLSSTNPTPMMDVFTELLAEGEINENLYGLARHPIILMYLTNLLGTEDIVEKYRNRVQPTPNLTGYLSRILNGETDDIQAYSSNLSLWVRDKAFTTVEKNSTAVEILQILGATSGRKSWDDLQRELNSEPDVTRIAIDCLKRSNVFLHVNDSQTYSLKKDIRHYLIEKQIIVVDTEDSNQSDSSEDYTWEHRKEAHPTAFARTCAVETLRTGSNVTGTVATKTPTFENLKNTLDYLASSARHVEFETLLEVQEGLITGFQFELEDDEEEYVKIALFEFCVSIITEEGPELLNSTDIEVLNMALWSWDELRFNLDPEIINRLLIGFDKILDNITLNPTITISSHLAAWLIDIDIRSLQYHPLAVMWLRLLSLTRSNHQLPDLRDLTNYWPCISLHIASELESSTGIPSWLSSLNGRGSIQTLALSDTEWNQNTFTVLDTLNLTNSEDWPEYTQSIQRWPLYTRPLSIPEGEESKFKTTGGTWIPGKNGLSLSKRPISLVDVPEFEVVDTYITNLAPSIKQEELSSQPSLSIDEKELLDFVYNKIKSRLESQGPFSADAVQNWIKYEYKTPVNDVIRRVTNDRFDRWTVWFKKHLNPTDQSYPLFSDFLLVENDMAIRSSGVGWIRWKSEDVSPPTPSENIQDKKFQSPALPTPKIAAWCFSIIFETLPSYRPTIWDRPWSSTKPATGGAKIRDVLSKSALASDAVMKYWAEEWNELKNLFYIVGYYHTLYNRDSLTPQWIRIYLHDWVEQKISIDVFEEKERDFVSNWLEKFMQDLPKYRDAARKAKESLS